MVAKIGYWLGQAAIAAGVLYIVHHATDSELTFAWWALMIGAYLASQRRTT